MKNFSLTAIHTGIYFVLVTAGVWAQPFEAQNPQTGSPVAREVSAVPEAVSPTALPEKNFSFQSMLDVLEVREMDIRDVLEIIAEKSGLEIAAGEDIEGRVTIYLKEVDVWDALRIILDMNNLAYKQEDGIVRIMTAQEFENKYGFPFGQRVKTRIVPIYHSQASDFVDILEKIKSPAGKVIFDEKTKTFILIDAPEKLNSMAAVIQQLDVPLERAIFPLENVRGEEILADIQAVLTRDAGKVEWDSATNSLIVHDKALKLKEIEELVKKLDHVEKEIFLETKIVQITLNDEHINGVDWAAIVSEYQNVHLNGAQKNDPAEHRDQDWELKNSSLSLGSITEEDYVVLLDALDTVGMVQTVSNSRFEVPPGREVKITIHARTSLNSSPVPAVSDSPPEDEAPGDEDSEHAEHPEDPESRLPEDSHAAWIYLTPGFSESGSIQLKLQPLLGIGRQGESTVLLKEGSILVVGGLFKDIRVASGWKIPLLGDLPILGFAFRAQGERLRPTEVITFVTPKVIVKE